MTAGDTQTKAGYVGSAKVTANFAKYEINLGAVDVAFTEIYAIGTGNRIGDIEFNDVPVTGGPAGHFATVDSPGADIETNGWVNGYFWGDESLPEVGGIFERQTIQGAFGAQRGP